MGAVKRVLFITILLFVACVAFALNPFVGEWKVSDDRYSFSDSHITGIMDNMYYESDYTYTDDIMIWRDRVWVYFFIDDDHFALLGFVGPNRAPMIWALERIPSFKLGEEDKA